MNKEQFIDTLQKFYDREGIKETANVELESPGAGVLNIKVITKRLLELESLITIEKICFLLMPAGILFEVINISTDQYGEQKLLSDGVDIKISIPPLPESVVISTDALEAMKPKK